MKRAFKLGLTIAGLLSLWFAISFWTALNDTPKDRASKCSKSTINTVLSPGADFGIHVVKQDCKAFGDFVSVQLVNNASGKKTEILGVSDRVQEKEILIDWVDYRTVHVNYSGSLDALNNFIHPSDDTFGIKINITMNESLKDY